MAVFLLKGKHGPYVPPPATGTVFGDVYAGRLRADWIEELAGFKTTGAAAAETTARPTR